MDRVECSQDYLGHRTAIIGSQEDHKKLLALQFTRWPEFGPSCMFLDKCIKASAGKNKRVGKSFK